jgi:phosphonoacetate hydrolase
MGRVYESVAGRPLRSVASGARVVGTVLARSSASVARDPQVLRRRRLLGHEGRAYPNEMSALPPATSNQRERALDVLLSHDLDPIVDMVGWSTENGQYEVASADGSVRFSRAPEGVRDFEIESVTGQNPLAVQDQKRFAGLEAERATPHPQRGDNSYPHAFEQFAQLFDHPSAPDLCVIHSASHNWVDQGGHLGEHGSLGVVQARAPFIVAGAGVPRLGMSDIGCRLTDVAPTMLQLLAADHILDEGSLLSHQDGSPIDALVGDGGRARHLIGILWDGTNANVLYDLAARGEAPNVARLIGDGTACRYGALASLPTVTLANHTTILTGSHPGHHGILHNAWVDRRTGAQVVTNSPATWAESMQWLNGGVQTMHDAAKRMRAGVTASINEPCDAGADYSTFGLVRSGKRPPPAPGPDDLPDATGRFVRPSKDYRWASRADHTAVDQFRQVWTSKGEPPVFTWVNFTLTDSAFHEGGPYSEMARSAVRDSDARLGRILQTVEQAGKWEDCAIFLVADHGMEESDPAVRGDWDIALKEADVPVRDEGYGFLYLSG